MSVTGLIGATWTGGNAMPPCHDRADRLGRVAFRNDSGNVAVVRSHTGYDCARKCAAGLSRWLPPALLASLMLTSPLEADELETALRDTAASLLAAWISESRDTALDEGVDRIPRNVRDELRGYVPDFILDRVRWRVGSDSLVSLQRGLIGFGYSPAVTVDYVVVFESHDAAADAPLWVHELRHVQQFIELGIQGFADQYLLDYNVLETDAAEYRWTWMKQTGRIPAP